MSILPNVDATTVRRARRLLEPLARYHRFRLEGAENLPRSGPVLLVVHHTLATYDGLLLAVAIQDATGRLPVGLGDDRIFQIPWLSDLASRVGMVPASPEAGEQILRAGGILGVAPGGMWESIRPRNERRHSRWEGRFGFARLALRCAAPIVVAGCPAGDDIYTVYPSRVTDALYRRFHLPAPLVRGLGPTLLPRRVPLVGYVGAPLVPPVWQPDQEDEQVRVLHEAACARMEELLAR